MNEAEQVVARQPMPGDAVRLSGHYTGAKIGSLGIINGIIGKPEEDLEIIFNYSAFRDERSVSVSGGPGTLGLPATKLTPTDEVALVYCWHYKDGQRRPGNSEYYEIAVPVWDWNGQYS